ncbi:MAG TPA: dihydrodipicolinate synthase family protein, partial [Enterococcus sp.]|nr:dihydrodipicolinate synthase family protein [Enterococcus sp.]
MAIFTGAGIALITPMLADGTVDFDKLKELAEWHVQQGADAIIACGTTGEASTLD